MLKLLNKLLLLTLVGGLFVITSCGDDDEDEFVPTQNVWEIVQAQSGGDDGLDSLAKYLAVYPNLVSTLETTGRDITLFAPTNAAFRSLLQTPGFPSNIADINPDIIEGVLAYHVVAGETVLAADLQAGNTYTTAQTEDITINPDGTLLTGATNTAIQVVEADLLATNGVVHKVGSVLIPPSVGQSLTPILGTLAGTVLLGADFSHLASFIERADSDVPSGESPVANILAAPTGSTGNPNGFTAFVPPNQVFEGAAADAGITVDQFIQDFTPAEARGVLLTHVTGDGVADSGSLSDMDTFTAASMVTLTITVEGTPTNSPTGVLVAAPGNASPVPVVQADLSHSNGIAHVIGGILLPQ